MAFYFVVVISSRKVSGHWGLLKRAWLLCKCTEIFVNVVDLGELHCEQVRGQVSEGMPSDFCRVSDKQSA